MYFSFRKWWHSIKKKPKQSPQRLTSPMPFAKHFVTEEEATLMLSWEMPKFWCKELHTAKQGKLLSLSKSIGTFRESGKGSRVHRFRLLKELSTAWAGEHFVEYVYTHKNDWFPRKLFDFTIVNTLKDNFIYLEIHSFGTGNTKIQ